MAVNFLHHLFQTKIECSAVSSDGYSHQNLVSPNWREKSQGFLAAHFIKPPVHLLFQLPFPVNLQSLVIKPKVGSQISSGIDVFVAGIKHDSSGDTLIQKRRTRRTNPSSCIQDSNVASDDSNAVIESKSKRQKIDSGVHYIEDKKPELLSQTDEDRYKESNYICHKYSTLISIESFKTDQRHLFSLVSRINEPYGRMARIVNKRYGGRLIQDNAAYEDDSIYEFFHSHTLNYVTHIVICISRMKGSCVPALGRVEIWGQASSSCSSSIINYITDIQKKVEQENKHYSVTKSYKNYQSTESVKGNSLDLDSTIQDKETPPDFIDPITCNLMTIPMILPSGLNIDLSTLEKHVEAEKSWGRLPSDPFTGVLFTNDVKPLPNGALKARIDKYILSSGIDVRSFGRTVGRSLGNLVSKKHLQRTVSKEPGNALGNEKINCKLLKHGTNEKCFVNNDVKTEPGQSVFNGNNKAVVMETDCSKEHGKVIVQSHEEKVSQSLDSALLKTLQGATFTRRDKGSKESLARNKPSMPCASSLVENNGEKTRYGSESKSQITAVTTDNLHSSSSLINSDCINCKKAFSTSNVFKLPCKHLICRKCLSDKLTSCKTLKCSLCGHIFSQKDVVKVHYF